eukprot:6212396-Prymnesium_polylepis.1
MHAPGMYPRDADTWTRTARYGVSTVTPRPHQASRACAGICTNDSCKHICLLSGLHPTALGAVAPLLCSSGPSPPLLFGTVAPFALRDCCPPRSVWDRRPTALCWTSM